MGIGAPPLATGWPTRARYARGWSTGITAGFSTAAAAGVARKVCVGFGTAAVGALTMAPQLAPSTLPEGGTTQCVCVCVSPLCCTQQHTTTLG